MALNRLLALMENQGAQPKLGTVSRWTETPSDQPWEAEPDYGFFVDDEVRVVTGSRPYRAYLESDEPNLLELAPETARTLAPSATVVFLDWGRQSLSWEEIFALWETWEEENRILDCGAVGVPWSLASRWISPGWIAFRESFDGAPLTTVVRKSSEPLSFLARARQWRNASDPV